MKMLRFLKISLLVGALLAGAALHSAKADTILYGSTGGDNASGGGLLYQINVTTQVVSFIGNTGFDRLGGIAFNSVGVLYGVSGGSALQSTLMTIDPTTGVATVIGLVSDPNANIDGLRFNSQGVLYGTAYNPSLSGGVLYTIDPSNANILTSLNLMGSGNSFCAGIAFDGAGNLYGSRGNSNGHTEDLDLINQGTGAMTPIGGMDAVISDIVFYPDGTLYASSPNGDLYSINPMTGGKTLLFNTGITQFSGLAAAVPEPSVTVLFGIAALSSFVLLRRRSHQTGRG